MALTRVDDWLDEYGESHRDPVNKAIHWVCVPLIALTVIGLLWALPVPRALASISPVMNWGMLFMMASVVYYFILSPSLGLGMVAEKTRRWRRDEMISSVSERVNVGAVDLGR